MKRIKRALPFGLGVTLILLSGISAEAGFQYSFDNITNNSPVSAAIGEAQLSVTVSDEGAGLVRFQFDNIGPEASSITDVYFDDRADPSLFVPVIDTIENQDGVQFAEMARPKNLPGGRNLDPRFKATRGLTADSDSPVQSNGVNPGETLGLLLELANGHIFQDVLSAIDSAALRIGIHVQGFANGESESFVNSGSPTPPPVVPEPSGLTLFSLAAIGLVLGQRWRRRTNSVDRA